MVTTREDRECPDRCRETSRAGWQLLGEIAALGQVEDSADILDAAPELIKKAAGLVAS